MEKEFITLSEAVEILREQTKKSWTELDILKLAKYKFQLVAIPAKMAPVQIEFFNSWHELVGKDIGDYGIGLIEGEQIEQLLQCGSTIARVCYQEDYFPITTLPNEDPSEADPQMYEVHVEFTPPIMVTTKMLGVSIIIIDRIINGEIPHPKNLTRIDGSPQETMKVAILKRTMQEDEILACICKLGYDPESLPKYKKDVINVKQQVRQVLSKNKKLFTAKSFDLAWERLRKDGRIKDSDTSN